MSVTAEELAQAADILRRWESDMASLDTSWTVVPTATHGKPRQAGFLRLAYKKTTLSALIDGLWSKVELDAMAEGEAS